MEHPQLYDEQYMILARNVINALVPPAFLDVQQRPPALPDQHNRAARDAWVQALLEGDDEQRGENEEQHPHNILPFLRYIPDLQQLQHAYQRLVEHVAGDDPDVGDPEVGPPRPFNLRRPYRITTLNRQTNWFEKSFEFEERLFRYIYRMSKATFDRVATLLQPNPIFQSRGRRPQRPVKYQLAVFLIRFGMRGSPTMEPVVKTGIGHGTVVLYCRRVTRALREIGQEVVAWPNEERKEEIKAWFGRKLGLDGVIGIVDGSLIELTHKPTVGGDAYYSRKKNISVNIQVIVDHLGRIISFEMGWPGSKPDSFVWGNSYIWRHRHQFFEPGEFLLGYPCTPYVLRPYAEDEMANDRARKQRFNKRLSRVRVQIECAFGRFKSRFPSLYLMGTPEDMKDLYRSVQALMVLHNLCIDFHDRVDGFAAGNLQRGHGSDSNIDIHARVGHINPEDIDDDDLTIPGEDLLEAGRTFRSEYI
ncbi:DDE superfamily endonuclease [Ceratobasidium sp. AG-Ba]|nr:DDE superfamily endonuclease [Ceratobasidium sp. AG-Ba]